MPVANVRGVFGLCRKTTQGDDGHCLNPVWFCFLIHMTKEEVKHALQISREIGVMDDTKNWRNAFDLYNVSNGTNLRAQDRCQKCFQKVLDWLNNLK